MLRVFSYLLVATAALILAHTPLAAQDIAAGRQAYLNGDYETAFAILRPAAEAGDAAAQNIMGAAYDNGNGVARDDERALYWYEQAAAQGFVKAQFNLGLFYNRDRAGRPAEPARAAQYFEQAAAQGYSHGMYERGRMYEAGRGGPADNAAAAALFRQAVDLGHVESLNNLGLMYIRGRGVDEDMAYGLALFQQAAEKGNALGISNLGAMYEHGYAVGQNSLVAMALYEKSARSGLARAAVNLAYMLIDGRNGWSDPARGYAWCEFALTMAEPADLEEFRESCTYLNSLLDEASRAEAETRLQELMR